MLIDRYRREYAVQYGRTVGKDLEQLARSELAQVRADQLRSVEIISARWNEHLSEELAKAT